jgi:hypothetical protein
MSKATTRAAKRTIKRAAKRSTKSTHRPKKKTAPPKYGSPAELLVHRAWLVESELEDQVERLLAIFRSMSVRHQAACFDRVLDAPSLAETVLGEASC